MPAPRTLSGFVRLLPAALLALSAVALAGCVERLSVDGVPGVPVGFGERVPEIPLSGYIFVRAPGDDATITIDTDLTLRDGSILPWRAEARSVSIWLSPVVADTGALTTTIRFSFDRESDAIAADTVLSRAGAGVGTWTSRNGRDAEIVMGDRAQVEAMRDILSGNLFAPREQLAQTGMWRNALSLPQAPPRPVIAAGFVAVEPERVTEILGWLKTQGIIDLTQFGDMLERLQVDNAVFAVYGDSVPTLSENVSLEELADHGLTGLVIARTGVPAPLVSLGFNVGAMRAGLDRVESRTGRYYRYEDESVVVLTQVRRGDIQVAASASPQDAVRILGLIPN